MNASSDSNVTSDTTPGAPDRELCLPPEAIFGSLRFERYRIMKELGRGGMGVVLLAQDEELNLPVALKMLPPAVARDAEAIAGLKAEVLRGMALTHPGIVRVHQFERDDEGAAVVMEYVPGENLADYKVREGCFDWDQVRPWLEQIAAALDYAHGEAHIAHRDLKPRNLMLTPDGRIKIADFGLASALSESLTRISARADSSGTPPYMSPQQVMGKQVTRADDIYALGVTVFELLTGKPPFFRGEIYAQVLHATPATMTERRGELQVQGKKPIPASWERAVAACLSKEPSDRPATAKAFLAMLDSAEEEAPMPVAPVVVPVPVVRVNRPTPPARDASARSEPHIGSSRRAGAAFPGYTVPAPSESEPELEPVGWQPATAVVAERERTQSSRWALKLCVTLAASALVAGVLHSNRDHTAKTTAPAVPSPAAAEASRSATPMPSSPNRLGGSTLQPAGGLDSSNNARKAR